MKHYFYPLALGLIALVGCSKSKSEETPKFDTTGTYTVSTTPEPRPMRMFTQTGEVRNDALIQRYFERQYAGLPIKSGVIPPFLAAELVFTSPSEAILNTTTLMSGTPQTSNVPLTFSGLTNERAVLTSKNPKPSTSPSGNSSKCDNIVRDIQGVSPVYTCTSLPPSTGFGTQCEFKPVYVLNLRGEQASIAIMFYYFSATVSGGSCGMGGNLFNVLNAALPGRIASGDTLVVQEAELPLVKK
ncbi:hypothetical protein [Hymenobacter siberiensis]|uniref:hypothetical protein n=1 Tax=Hymenobacter siberiensis TaxID=2848396 RepID=UPI001C1E17BC|nr:hypothetical protein [Hymenobacter siberiensis]MBU6122816.1 hypothetical protein [Hymenobacter siberiensis]